MPLTPDDMLKKIAYSVPDDIKDPQSDIQYDAIKFKDLLVSALALGQAIANILINLELTEEEN